MAASTIGWLTVVLTLGVASWTGAQEPTALSDEPGAAPGDTGATVGPVEAPGLWEDPISAAVRAEARAATGSHLVISLEDRLLFWMDGGDTLRLAPIATGKGTRLEHEDQVWDFSTPRGVRRVLAKQTNPVWSPPDWHYVELARDSGLVLLPLSRESGARLLDGSRLVVRGDRIAREFGDGRVEIIPADEEVVFGDTLFIPPHGTANRRIEGELGEYKLDLGDGYMIHGTPHKTSIGEAATHGCIRMRDGDLEYLFHRVPIGTPVYIY